MLFHCHILFHFVKSSPTIYPHDTPCNFRSFWFTTKNGVTSGLLPQLLQTEAYRDGLGITSACIRLVAVSKLSFICLSSPPRLLPPLFCKNIHSVSIERPSKVNEIIYRVQRSAKVFVRGCEKFVPALAYLFCPALPGSCSARFAYIFADLCNLKQSSQVPVMSCDNVAIYRVIHQVWTEILLTFHYKLRFSMSTLTQNWMSTKALSRPDE